MINPHTPEFVFGLAECWLCNCSPGTEDHNLCKRMGRTGLDCRGVWHYVVLAVAWACHGRSPPGGSGLVSTEVSVFLS